MSRVIPSPLGIPGETSSLRVSRRTLLRTSFSGLALATAAAPHHMQAAQDDGATPTSEAVIDIEALDQFIPEAMDRYGVPGAAVAVVQNGAPILVKGYGLREVGTDATVDADTVFQLASNTKPFTAFAAGILVEEGLIGWDTPIREVLPELQLMDPYASRNVTLRDVLAHRSGLPAFTGDLLDVLGYDRDEVLHRLRFVEPGSTFREVAAYSNLGFFIAGQVIERLTGGSWEEAVRERVMQPLAMDRSAPSIIDLRVEENISSHHARMGGNVEVIDANYQPVLAAAGAALSTANDMARWMQMLLDGGSGNGHPLMSPATVQEMFLPSMVSEVSFTELPPIDEHTGFSYGLGWGNFHYHGYPVIEKGGALGGIRTVVDLVPDLNFGIAVLANLNLTFLPEAIRAFALEQVLGSSPADFQAEIEATAAMVDQLLVPVPLPPDPVAPTVPLQAFTGLYDNDLYGRFEVIASGDELRVEAGPAGHPAELTHYSRDTFLLDWGSATGSPDETTFTIGPDGIAEAFEAEGLGRFDRAPAE
jgi:CubicO group peptidase (beta-lactamase class C family)